MKNPMRIGLVCPYNMTKGGGVQECVRALRDGLAKRGHAVKIITPLPRQNNVVEEKDVIYVGRARDFKSPFATVGQISVSINTKAMESVLEKERFDILHFHEPWVPIVSRQILSRSTAKNVATFHAKLPDTMMSKTIERVITPYTKSIISYLDGYTAVSDAAAEYVASITDEPIEIIPNGIHLQNFTGKRDNGHNTFLYVGRLERRKGVKYLIKAFAGLVDSLPDAKLVIAGDGPDRPKLELLCQQLEISDDVHFAGFVSEEEKDRLFKTSRVFCSPAMYGESFGIVLLEAMAYGLPLVAGNNPGYTGVLQDLGAISVVNPKDTEEFTRRLLVFAENEQLRDTWQNWAKTYVKRFDYEEVVSHYEDFYQRLLDE
ncbi:MAG: glycosyltransferase family 4 protein [Candidatus Saccharibacteria bacterium]|nr:glycosyltransferase family 4 protein [Candidatus Saccharibacteria bacterium]